MFGDRENRDRDFGYVKEEIEKYELTKDTKHLRSTIVWLEHVIRFNDSMKKVHKIEPDKKGTNYG